jgi:DNA-binding NtrC family response regulator
LKINTVIISAYGTSQLKEEFLSLGAIAFIDKPFKIDALMKISQAALENL